MRNFIMKNITDIQDLIKNKNQLCIFVDYNHITDTFAPFYFSDARISQTLRIVENLASLQFVNINVINKFKTPQKEINKLSSKLKNVKFLKYEKIVLLANVPLLIQKQYYYT